MSISIIDYMEYADDAAAQTAYVSSGPPAELDYMEYANDVAAQAAYVSSDVDSYTKLLLHCNGVGGSSDFPDASVAGHNAVAVANAQVDTVIKKFGTGSLLLGGTDDYLTVDMEADLNVGANDFTIDFWFYVTSNTEAYIFDTQGPTDRMAIVRNTDGELISYFAGASGIVMATGINIETLYHLALVKDHSENKLQCFIGGISTKDQEDTNVYNTENDFWIGARSSAEAFFHGQIDEFRYSKGIARWTENFDVPTGEYKDNLQSYSENTIKTQGSYSLKGIAGITDSLNDTLTRIVGEYGDDVCADGTPFADDFRPPRDPEYAFDGDSGTYWDSNEAGFPHYLGYDFGDGNAKIIKQYTVTSRVSPYQPSAPKDWTFEGSNNGIDYDVLDTVTNQTGWNSAGEKRTFEIPNSTLYRYYKITLASSNTNPYIVIDELEMMEFYGAIDLSGYDIVKFDIYSSRTGENIKIGIHDSGGTTTEITPDILSAGEWQEVEWDISGVSDANKDDIDSIIITIVNADAENTFYIDNMERSIVLQSYSEDTIIQQGSYSLKGIAGITDSLNETLTRTVAPTIDLSYNTRIKFDIRTSRTGSNIKIGFQDSGGEWIEHTANILVADTWQTETIDMSGVAITDRDVIDFVRITITNADAANTFYIDNIYAEGKVLEQHSGFTALDNIDMDSHKIGRAADPDVAQDVATKNYVDNQIDNRIITEAYILLKDIKTENTDGGTFTQDAWRTRDINTEETDTDDNCSIASNQITLVAGTYECIIKCPAFSINYHKARLQNITDGSTELWGTSEHSNSSYDGHTSSFIIGRFTIASEKIFEIQHWCTMSRATIGFGGATDITGVSELYTIAEFRKVT